MKKIAILTIQDVNNFGNRLQNYAMQTILLKSGYQVESLKFKPRVAVPAGYFKEKFILCLKVCKEILINIRRYKRYQSFKCFNKNIVFGPIITYNNAKKIDKKYDFFVVGSDQIWNHSFYKSMYINYLCFTEKNKKIALSPSISNNNFTEKQADYLMNSLNDFLYLSCREREGADIIMNLTGRNCNTLLDPTLMLNRDDWDIIIKKPKCMTALKKYALVYFLGGISSVSEEYIKNLKDTNDLEIINLLDKSSPFYNCGPSEFVYLIKNCQIMLTDSFHGTIFSFIYDRPLQIFTRQGKGSIMNSRLTNLVEMINLPKECFYDSNESLSIIKDINYNKNNLILQQKRFTDTLADIFK